MVKITWTQFLSSQDHEHTLLCVLLQLKVVFLKSALKAQLSCFDSTQLHFKGILTLQRVQITGSQYLLPPHPLHSWFKWHRILKLTLSCYPRTLQRMLLPKWFLVHQAWKEPSIPDSSRDHLYSEYSLHHIIMILYSKFRYFFSLSSKPSDITSQIYFQHISSRDLLYVKLNLISVDCI